MRLAEIPVGPQLSSDRAALREVPALLMQLQDDLSRSHRREAFWMSLALHLLVVIGLVTAPRWAGFSQPVPVPTAQELIGGKELTYLDLGHDRQKVDKAPDTDRISDKNRIATKRPMVDRKTLDELRDSARPGPPGLPAPGGPASQSVMPSGSAQAAQAGPAEPRPAPQTQARLESPLTNRSGFGAPALPGQAIQQAARAAAAGRVGGTFGGAGGDYGLGHGTEGKIYSDMDILSDTMGVDFGPYLARVLHDVRINWYNVIPEAARPPLMKKGKVAIEFAILKDGQVAGLKLAGGSGDVSLDRAAWGGITASNPFPPLPAEFRGSYLSLRFHFYYNPDKGDLQ
jgi:TonB family protein